MEEEVLDDTTDDTTDETILDEPEESDETEAAEGTEGEESEQKAGVTSCPIQPAWRASLSQYDCNFLVELEKYVICSGIFPTIGLTGMCYFLHF